MAQKECLEYLQEHKKATRSEMAEEQNISNTSISRNMESLVKKGLADKNQETKPIIYKITEKGMDLDPDTLGGMVV